MNVTPQSLEAEQSILGGVIETSLDPAPSAIDGDVGDVGHRLFGNFSNRTKAVGPVSRKRKELSAEVLITSLARSPR